MQCARIDAKVEEAYQHSIEQGGSPIPQAAETPRRRPERGIQQNDIPKSPKPKGKLDVFHQRNVGETTQVLKDRCSNEDGLVSKQWSHQRIQAPNQTSHKTIPARRSSKRRWKAPPEIDSFLAVFSNAATCSGLNSESA